MRLRARVPATVANLGSAFDAAALALAVTNTFVVDTDAPPGLAVEGEGAAELPRDQSNLVLVAMARAAEEAGGRLPAAGLTCTNRIPLERGLGSSAAAIVGGLLLADGLLDARLDARRLLDLAADLEGHADNAAACLSGGLAMVYRTAGGWRSERVDPSPDIRPVLLIPTSERVSTGAARVAVPRSVDLDDAVFNLSRSALLALAFTDRPELLANALDDRLHQRHRLPLMPVAASKLDELRGDGIPACIAGSGPAVLALETDDRPVKDPGEGWWTLRPEVDRTGAAIE